MSNENLLTNLIKEIESKVSNLELSALQSVIEENENLKDNIEDFEQYTDTLKKENEKLIKEINALNNKIEDLEKVCMSQEELKKEKEKLRNDKRDFQVLMLQKDCENKDNIIDVYKEITASILKVPTIRKPIQESIPVVIPSNNVITDKHDTAHYNIDGRIEAHNKVITDTEIEK